MNVLVIGRAKTGTTIISKTIHKSMENALFLMEPKAIERFLVPYNQDLVAKIIFEHWNKTPRLRVAVLFNELAVKFDKSVLIVRDPRDELISRLFYILFGYVKDGKVTRDQLTPWLDIVKRKELHPESVSLKDMMGVLNRILNININFQLNDTFHYFNFIRNQSADAKSFVLHYEDFISGKTRELESYLGIELTSERSVDELSNRVMRTASFNNWKSFYLQSDLDRFKELHQDKMEKMGYTDWELSSTPELDPEHGSVYLNRLLDEAEARLVKS
jgi:hypothetical protein